jgi:copper resistance protein D
MSILQRWVYLRTAVITIVAVAAMIAAWSPTLPAYQNDGQDMQSMPDMPGMDMQHDNAPESPAVIAKRAKDKKESEFNHHLAGVLVAIAGVFLLMQDKLAKRRPAARFVWPFCFLAAGVFLLVFSDTEMWPFGHQSIWYAITHNPEVLQHKVFALILLALGGVELQRARGKLQNAWSPWVFPVVGMVGVVMLLFHHHSAGMHGAHHMETMAHIQAQHREFAEASCGIAVTKGLAEMHTNWQSAFNKIWPIFMIVLGVLLMMYTE